MRFAGLLCSGEFMRGAPWTSTGHLVDARVGSAHRVPYWALGGSTHQAAASRGGTRADMSVLARPAGGVCLGSSVPLADARGQSRTWIGWHRHSVVWLHSSMLDELRGLLLRVCCWVAYTQLRAAVQEQRARSLCTRTPQVLAVPQAWAPAGCGFGYRACAGAHAACQLLRRGMACA